jgi:hypothetical protein
MSGKHLRGERRRGAIVDAYSDEAVSNCQQRDNAAWISILIRNAASGYFAALLLFLLHGRPPPARIILSGAAKC